LLSPKNECIALRRIKEFEKKGFHLKSYQGNILNNFIRYSSIDSFKGLESDVVLLTDLDYLVKNKKDKNIYYTGLSRSTDKIYTFQNNNFIKSLTDS
jgi:DNA helicase IV